MDKPPFFVGMPPVVIWDDLTERVTHADRVGDAAFSRDQTISEFFDVLARSLHRPEPRHVILLRESGVGEVATLAEFVRRGLKGFPPFLSRVRFVRIDCRSIPIDIIREGLQSRLNPALSAEECVLCLDHFASTAKAYGVGDCRGAALSLLYRMTCRVIAIVSPREFEDLSTDDGGLNELCSTVTLREPSPSVAEAMVRHLAVGLEERYCLRIDDEAVHEATVLSGNYILNERLPTKAVKVLRSICDDVEYERTQLKSGRDQITRDDVISKVASVSGIPAETLTGVGESTDYFEGLSRVIVGQDHAVREVAAELGLIKAGMIDPDKPASVMLFVGQTGTGKTEMAKALARFYSASKRLKTFTLGNFSEPHSISGLIGVPAGYVGHERGGRLINELNADPYGVFLLDEADKAHPDVMQPFLNLFDEGWIYDQRGVKGYAHRAIFILTTNVGQRQIAEMYKQGKTTDEITSTMKESLSRIRHTKSNRPVFTAEFLARIKRVIVFRPLDQDAMTGIGRRLLAEMQRNWEMIRHKSLRVDEQLVDLISKRACKLDNQSQGREGGRIVRKLIADLVETPLQQNIVRYPDEYRRNTILDVTCDLIEAGNVEELPVSELRRRIRVGFSSQVIHPEDCEKVGA